MGGCISILSMGELMSVLFIFGLITICIITFVIEWIIIKLCNKTKETLHLEEIALLSIEIMAISTLLIIMLIII